MNEKTDFLEEWEMRMMTIEIYFADPFYLKVPLKWEYPLFQFVFFVESWDKNAIVDVS